jgi:hypothetical protein
MRMLRGVIAATVMLAGCTDGLGEPPTSGETAPLTVSSRGMPVRLRLWFLACFVVAMLVACGGDGQEPSVAPGASSPPAPTVSTSPPPQCPNPEGQACLGELAPGHYTTTVFTPTLTYTVPVDWSNLEDTPGNFLLVPPRGNLPGVNKDTSDFIGVYSSIAAPDGCQFHGAPEVKRSVSGIAGWMARNPGLAITNRHDVNIGGLEGVVFDIKMANGWTKTCPYLRQEPLVPLIVGVGLSGLEHAILPQSSTRLYLLDNSMGGVLAIEVVNVQEGDHLDEYSSVVEGMRFAS